MSLLRIEESGGTRRLCVVNPASLAPVGEVPVAGPGEVVRAIGAARAAQPAWGAVPPSERVHVLARARALMLADLDAWTRAVHDETGKPRREALLADLQPALDALDWTVGAAAHVLAEERIPLRRRFAFADSRLAFHPLGVVGIISPWNYPVGIPGSQIAAALAAGNAVVLKPSEHVPHAALRLAKLFAEAGLPPGVLQVVPGDGATGAALATAEIDKLVFTGSVATGRRVAVEAARRGVPAVMELGGSDPMVVLDDADPDAAVAGALWSRFVNAGQTCAAVKRCFVARSLVARFTEALSAAAEQLRLGVDSVFDVDVGPLISEAQRGQIESQVAEAEEGGARVAAGGRRADDLPGWFYRPTVLDRVHPSMRVLREETFGPVLPVVAFDSEDEAVRLANDTRFGLSASVWSRDVEHARRVASKLVAGSVWLNTHLWTFGLHESPWGGVRDSGPGTTHGVEGLRSFCRVQHVAADRLPARKPWWFPYSGGPTGYERDRELLRGVYGGKLGPLAKSLAGFGRDMIRRR